MIDEPSKPAWAMQTRLERTLAERAYAMIHDAIATGALAPGDRLRIEELAEWLDMSMTPIREALHRLEEVGLAEHVPHRGARVTELSAVDLRELYEARLALEPLAVERAALHFRPEAAIKARACLDRELIAVRSGDIGDAWRTHTDFHFTLYRESGSAWLMRLIEPLWQSSQRYRLRLEPLRLDLPRREGEHRSILDACSRHEPERARAEMWNHLVRTANQISKHMGGPPLYALSDGAGA
ncbi:MAG: GntR family transcriptional regulator [Candidatus Dormibacteraceae bacterium]